MFFFVFNSCPVSIQKCFQNILKSVPWKRDCENVKIMLFDIFWTETQDSQFFLAVLPVHCKNKHDFSKSLKKSINNLTSLLDCNWEIPSGFGTFYEILFVVIFNLPKTCNQNQITIYDLNILKNLYLEQEFSDRSWGYK